MNVYCCRAVFGECDDYGHSVEYEHGDIIEAETRGKARAEFAWRNCIEFTYPMSIRLMPDQTVEARKEP